MLRIHTSVLKELRVHTKTAKNTDVAVPHMRETQNDSTCVISLCRLFTLHTLHLITLSLKRGSEMARPSTEFLV